MLQLEITDEYMEALQEVAKSHGESRRQYWADYLVKVCDSIPGLMEKIRQDRSVNYNVPAPKGEMGAPRNLSATAPIKERLRRYRFTYRDESLGSIEGVGEAAGPALMDATGRSWLYDEYIKIFLEPQLLGYVEE